MKRPSDGSKDWDSLRAKVIGLGKQSVQKSYYPELQERLGELERFRALLDQSNDGILLVGVPSGRLVDMNERVCELLGCSRHEVLGLSFTDLVPEFVSEEMGRILSGEEAIGQARTTITTEFQGGDGVVIPVEMTVRLVDLEEGSYAVVVARDIQERRQMEGALRFTQFSVDRAAISVFWMGPDARFLYVNDAACAALGYSRDELSSMRVQDIDPDFPEAGWASHWAEIKRKGSFTVESHHRRKDGTVFPVEITVNYLEYEGKEYNCAFARDITERKRAAEEQANLEGQLRHSQKMEAIGLLAGGVAHDFNNLLTVILGNVEFLKRDLSGAAAGREELDRIEWAGLRGASLTRQLLALSRRQVVKSEILDLNIVLSEMEDLIGRLIGEGYGLTVFRRPGLGRIRADAGQIEQVVMNLVINARDAMPGGGKLTIETETVELDEDYASRHAGVEAGSYVMLAVTDTGCGMDGPTQERIFEPFFTTKGPWAREWVGAVDGVRDCAAGERGYSGVQ